MKNVNEFEGSLWRGSRIIRAIYKGACPRINSTQEMRATLRAGPYAWPGGYQMYLITSDGAALCFDCARKEYRQISESIRKGTADGWKVEATDINYEDTSLYCENCSKQIPASYASDEENAAHTEL
jgi:hypothetical protein